MVYVRIMKVAHCKKYSYLIALSLKLKYFLQGTG